MKTGILFLFLILTSTVSAQIQHYEMGFGYTFTAPIATMKQNVKYGNGFTMDLYFTPENKNRFAFGMDLNYTIYGHDKSRQEYTFSDGSTAKMDIIVDNSFLNFMIGGRYFLTDIEGKKIQPYMTVKGGYSWFRTNLNIYDPDDNDHCEPVDADLLLKDGTYVFSGGAGFHWDLSSVFKRKEPNRFLFNLGANLTLGGKVNYMNTDAPSHNTNNNMQTDVTAQFLNTQTQVVHEHHVGYVYTSFVEMVEIRAGFVFRMEPRFRLF
ncbi:MAG: hypothetical protein WAZ98_00495 [Cyclobacteriaceae bacterium]